MLARIVVIAVAIVAGSNVKKGGEEVAAKRRCEKGQGQGRKERKEGKRKRTH